MTPTDIAVRFARDRDIRNYDRNLTCSNEMELFRQRDLYVVVDGLPNSN